MFQKQRRRSPRDQEVIDKYCNDMLEAGFNNMRFQLHRFKYLHRRFVATFQIMLEPNSRPALLFEELLGLRGEKNKRSFADEVFDLDRDATARAKQAEGCKSEEELATVAFQLGVRAVDYIELELVGPNARSDKGLYESARHDYLHARPPFADGQRVRRDHG